MNLNSTVIISRREWLRVSIYAAILILITLMPYWLGWSSAGEDRVFSGFLFGVDDGNSYIGKMRLGAQGEWNFHLFYTAEPHDSAGLIFLPYIVPGQIVRLFVAETDPALTPALIGTFHFMRVIFNALLIGVLYRFISVFLRSGWTRFFALILATLGGGLGWLLLLIGGLPPEWYIPEGFTLQILLGLPHLALARALLLLGFLALFASLKRTQWQAWALLAGLCWLIVGVAVPFYLAILYCILGAWGLALWLRTRVFPLRLFWRCLLAGLITLPYFAYNAYIFSSNPAFAQWSAQNLLASPSPLDYLLAYLPLAALAIVGGRWAWRKANIDSRYALLIGWPVIVPFLVYLPINVQRRMAEAVIVPLAILASAGVMLLARRARAYRRGRRRAALIALLAILPASLFLLVGAYFTAMSSNPPTKFPAAQIAALDWLNQHGQPGEVVLSTFETGNLVPAYTHLYSYVGHGPETLNAIAKTAVAENFFADDASVLSAEERAELYQTQGIRYVFYGPNERQFAAEPEAEPRWTQDLELIYSEGDYAIYALQP